MRISRTISNYVILFMLFRFWAIGLCCARSSERPSALMMDNSRLSETISHEGVGNAKRHITLRFKHHTNLLDYIIGNILLLDHNFYYCSLLSTTQSHARAGFLKSFPRGSHPTRGRRVARRVAVTWRGSRSIRVPNRSV